MATPLTAPFVEPVDVAYWLPAILKGGSDFSEETSPTRLQVIKYIEFVSTQIQMRFSAAGYKLPFVAYNDETWPELQNSYLKFITILGVAQWAGKWVNLPAPASPGNEPNRGNVFEENFFNELTNIWNGATTDIKFRADHYLGTPAELAINEPYPPVVTSENPQIGMANSTYNLWNYSINKELTLAFDAIFGVPITVQLFDPSSGFDTTGLAFGIVDNYPLDTRTLVTDISQLRA